ncbi:MAG: SDR family oxidoreductase [Chloroflexota bacterium]|nr:SDR family oxidoreductase [Chloroflexota bacterium]
MTQPTMHEKICLVTGASSGIGQEAALGLAHMGATVLMVARDRTRGERAASEIRHKVPEGKVELLVADLSSLDEVRQLAKQVLKQYDRLDVLLNNAGVALAERHVTVDGLEATLATNYLSPFLLTNLLLDRLKKSAPARIVNVASYTHTWVRSIPWDDLQSERTYDSRSVYNLTKLMDILFTYELARQLTGTGVTVNCLHPGWPMKTNLDREAKGVFALFGKISNLFALSAEQGATTSLYLASSPEVAHSSGRYFAKCQPAESSQLSHDEAVASRLWNISKKLCGF